MRFSIPDALAANRVNLDDEASHVSIDQEAARGTGTDVRIIACCPAQVYSRGADGNVVIEYAACLECGTCLAVAAPGTLRWNYPRGGLGISYRTS